MKTIRNLYADPSFDSSSSLDELLRCPRPINTATDEGRTWCQANGHCGCVEIDVLRKEYGEAVYPLNNSEGE